MYLLLFLLLLFLLARVDILRQNLLLRRRELDHAGLAILTRCHPLVQFFLIETIDREFPIRLGNVGLSKALNERFELLGAVPGVPFIFPCWLLTDQLLELLNSFGFDFALLLQLFVMYDYLVPSCRYVWLESKI